MIQTEVKSVLKPCSIAVKDEKIAKYEAELEKKLKNQDSVYHGIGNRTKLYLINGVPSLVAALVDVSTDLFTDWQSKKQGLEVLTEIVHNEITDERLEAWSSGEGKTFKDPLKALNLWLIKICSKSLSK